MEDVIIKVITGINPNVTDPLSACPYRLILSITI